MTDLLLFLSFALNVVILVVVWMRKSSNLSSERMMAQFEILAKALERTDAAIRDEIARNREESNRIAKENRQEIAQNFKVLSDSVFVNLRSMAGQQKDQLDSFSKQLTELTRLNEQKLDKIRDTVEQKLTVLQEDNSKKLEQMRETVNEKLHQTLEKRLGESFQQVSERLEQVHKGLGEMQTLASGVGDLKKVLTNVKTRGTLGEIQLENLLDQILTVDQYEKNFAPKKGSAERVEFAIKLPGKDHTDQPVWLPIDSKFPIEDYQRLLDAQEAGDLQAANEAAKLLESRIKQEAKSIREKYIHPPTTTDFGILFLPIEGLFAEVLRRSGLWETLQRDYRVIVTGPTTITALLNSLQMGFRTLAIQKRSSEVWQLLGAVKTEFWKFGEVLDKTKKKLEEASKTIDTAATRSRAIERKLKKVETLPASEANALLLGLSEETDLETVSETDEDTGTDTNMGKGTDFDPDAAEDHLQEIG